MRPTLTNLSFYRASVQLGAAALLAALATPLAAQTKPAPATPVVAASAVAPSNPGKSAETGEEATTADNKGRIKIHGHWLIEVKSRDGTVTERREFENSYVGGYIMGLYLGGIDSPADPAIRFFSSNNGSGSLCNGLTTSNVCILAESQSAGQGGLDANVYNLCTPSPSGCFSGLTAALTPAGGPYTSWVLNGVVTMPTGGTFDTVATSVSGCYSPYFNSPTSTSSEACYANATTYATNTATATSGSAGPFLTNNYFTSTLLPGGAVTVAAGQTLVFTVTISFS